MCSPKQFIFTQYGPWTHMLWLIIRDHLISELGLPQSGKKILNKQGFYVSCLKKNKNPTSTYLTAVLSWYFCKQTVQSTL